MNATSMIMNLVSDPKDNGEYELHLTGKELLDLWKVVQDQESRLAAFENQFPNQNTNLTRNEPAHSR